MTAATELVPAEARAFYQHALDVLEAASVPFLVGGAYAFARYTGIERYTKDFDIFIKRTDYDKAAEALRSAGYVTDLMFPHWLGKAFHGEDFVDLIFGAGNGVAEVDDVWFQHSVPEKVLDKDVGLIPAEEMIWSKGLIMERERYDGADVIHVIQAVGEKLDWRRLIDRFGPYWRVLYAHIILFGFVYPTHRSKVPRWVMEELGNRLVHEVGQNDAIEKICYGPIISRQQYLPDIDNREYKDARLVPIGKLTAGEIAHWNAAIDQEK